MVVTKIYPEPPICKKEILRYAGCKGDADEVLQLLLDECLAEILPKLNYKVCYMELPLIVTEQTSDLGCLQVKSKDLAKNLQNCENVILLAATIGVDIDRLIMKYGAVSPAKAMMFQAIGAERIESLCDVFVKEIQREWKEEQEEVSISLRPRFSPGYGDLPLETQKDIFKVLNCSKNIGLSLNDSLLMSPSKSVTAFVGITEVTPSASEEAGGASIEQTEGSHNCALCKKTDCAYRI